MNAEHTNFTQFLSQHLNNEQRKAVTHKNGPILVIAGAGSGKTRVITARIAHLILNEQVQSSSIVALTFTNKAAGEMKERIVRFIPQENFRSFIGTFHSYCLYLLKLYGNLIGHTTFSIIDADDQQQLLASIIKKNHLEKRITAKQLAHHIGMIKNGTTSYNDIVDPLIHQLHNQYEREKKVSKCIDFDDLLIEALKLFDIPSFADQFFFKTRHILVDEYQDTNIIQHTLLKKMSLSNKKFMIDSLCAVGDEDQSIYSWRGATVSNILHFKDDFPKTTVITIDQNYRSASSILNVANHIIKHNRQRNPKNLWSEKKANDRVRMVNCVSGNQEGQLIALLLKQIKKKFSLNEIAILYRAHYQSRTIEETLIRHSIPYIIIGGIAFYERKEIKDLLAYLRLIVNPFDKISFSRIINCPHRGLGDKFQEQFFELWDNEPFLTWIDVSKKLIQEKLISPSKIETLTQFINVITSFKASDMPRIVLQAIIEHIQYVAYLKDTFDRDEAETKLDNIKELLRATTHFEQRGISTLSDFLAEVTLMQQKTEDKNAEQQVQLMTLHAAKGLEFEVVLLTGLEEGIFPSQHALHNPESIEEERRLFYVGITRAREYLLLSAARYRFTYGSMNDQVPSRFFDEVPSALARLDISYWNDAQINDFCAEWFGINTFKPSLLTFGTSTKIPQTKERIVIRKEKDSFTVNQTVKHEKFGIGIIKSIDKKDPFDSSILTVQFKKDLKKIKASFLTLL